MQNTYTLNLSDQPLSEWRGSLTIFDSTKKTIPVDELNDVSWPKVSALLRPHEPAKINNKEEGQFVLPCQLKDAPLIGKTLEAAKEAGKPTIGKMRSNDHITDTSMLIFDIDGLPKEEFDALLERLKKYSITYLIYTTYSHGAPNKPGMRIRLTMPIDCSVDAEEYTLTWHSFNQHYLNGKADLTGAKLCQLQAIWSCHPSRVNRAGFWHKDGGVVLTDALLQMGKQTQSKQSVKYSHAAPNNDKSFPPSDANKIANHCRQIGKFRDNKGIGQSEPLWFDCLGITAHCTDGEAISQEWSSSYADYDQVETAKKIAYRVKTAPTTCDQFKKSNPADCEGCINERNSPITLGWVDKFEVIKNPTTKANLTCDVNETPASELNAQSNTPVAIPTDEEVITQLAAMKAMEYDRVRLDKAKELGVQVKTLDNLVKAVRNEEIVDEQLPFPEIELYPGPIDLPLLLKEISNIIRRFIVLDTEQADTAALWVAHTYLIDVFDTSPIAIINAPEKACAKTLLQTLLARMVYRCLLASNASASSLFRAVELWKPTIFFDEADTFFRDNKELQGMINAGHSRGGFVLRSEAVGDSFIPRKFSVYCAKSIAGITLEKHLPDATMSRGIVFNMRRKRADEKVERIRNADTAEFEFIQSKLMRFAQDYAQQLRIARPALSDALSDRDQDNWEPLLAIAECAGPDWLNRATDAALKLSDNSEDSLCISAQLLSDIQNIFNNGEHPRKISTVDLIKALCNDDEAPWATYSWGKPITPRQLAKLLAGYGIKSKTVRLGHANTPKGYDADQFEDAFARYLADSPKLPQQRNNSPESNNDKD